jgi:hypothetical protein
MRSLRIDEILEFTNGLKRHTPEYALTLMEYNGGRLSGGACPVVRRHLDLVARISRARRGSVIMKTFLVASAFGVLALAAVAQTTDVPLKPGMYSITSSTGSPGQAAQPSTSGQHCISGNDMKDPENVFSPAVYATNRTSTQCRVENFSRSGNKISYDVQCPRALTQVEVTLAGDTFQGSRTVRPRAGAAVRSVTRIEGKRTGDCGKLG